MPPQSDIRILALIEELRVLPAETEWLEFKIGNANPERIGKTVSALSNSARLADRPLAYMVWGISDSTQIVVGTDFEPSKAACGGEPLHFWLAKMLSPSPNINFLSVIHAAGRVVVLEIPAAQSVSVKFQHIAYVRIGSATPKLADYPEREEALVSKLRPFAWERGVAISFVSGEDVTDLLDHSAYFSLTGQKEPDSRFKVLERLAEDRLIERDVGGRWNILNLGAVLFARQLERFESVSRKALRIIIYDGLNRLRTKRRHDEPRGYAAAFVAIIDYIDTLLPGGELIDALRQEHRTYPQIALRELVANALIHQDMTITGTGPMVEIYQDRIEITNPGEPITEMVTKLFGARPRSRNERLADLMRKMGICEEQGSGLVKVVSAVEKARLPAPNFALVGGSTCATLFAPKGFAHMDRQDRVRVCYQHTALLFQSGLRMTNATLRDRFVIDERNAAQVSRVIRDCLEQHLIRVADSDRPKAGYVPFWA